MSIYLETKVPPKTTNVSSFSIQLTEEREESDEVRRQLQNAKRKLNKMTGEMEDMRLLLESVQSRNSDLEKKQKRYFKLYQQLLNPKLSAKSLRILKNSEQFLHTKLAATI